MESLFEQVKHGRVWPLTGGVHPPACKENTSGLPIVSMPLPQKLVLPLKQHIGAGGKLLVSDGDYVLKGQPLTEPVKGMSLPIHAPTSGIVEQVISHPIAHPSGLSEPCLFLTPDGKEQWVEREPMPHFSAETPEYLVNKIKMAGISGLGGAGFPAYIKSASLRNINYLIVNATECEPYITADESLIQRSAEDIIQGIDIVANIVHPNMILIGIEDDKPQAIKALQEATAHRSDIKVRVFPAKYPSGGEKQLIKILTGEEVPSGGFPVDVGILVHNIGTLHAIYNAVVRDEPLISRVVTVTGESVKNPQNIEVMIGTPVVDLLEHCGFTPTKNQRVIMGGPMMGFTLHDSQAPVVKISNCILAPGKGELPDPEDEMDCIRCGACADACPVSLLPQQMFWYAKAKDLAKAQEYNIKDCIECGACAYVCPSQIPLVQYYRVSKAEIRAEDHEKQQAEKAKLRFEARQARLERDAIEREEKQRLAAEKRKKAMAKSGGSNAVADALARVKAKKAAQTQETNSPEQDKPLSGAAAAVARAKARKQQQAAVQGEQSSEKPLTGAAAAVAKAKARKQQQAADQDKQDEQSSEKPLTGAAAAVAKAKARKQQQAAEQDGQNEQSSEKPLTGAAAAVAKAKARKQQQAAKQDEQSSEKPLTGAAAAVAKAKERKRLQALEQSQDATVKDSNEPSSEPVENTKKAAIAAAVAKAKARKQIKEQTAKVDSDAKAHQEQPAQNEIIDTSSEDEPSSVQNLEVKAPEIKEPVELSPEEAKKARIAAAVAKAKAKRQSKQSAEDTNNESNDNS